MIRRPTITAVLKVGTSTYPLSVLPEGSITKDEAWAPHFQGQIVIARPSLTVLALIDPDLDARVVLTLGIDNPTSSVVLELNVLAKQVEKDRIGISLASNESKLQAYSRVATTPDRTAWQQQSSLRTIVTTAISKVPNVPTTVDWLADLTAFRTYSAAENLLAQWGSFENNSVTGFGAGANTIASSTAWANSGTYSMVITPNSATSNDSYADLSIQNLVASRVGKVFTIRAQHRRTANQVSSPAPHARARSIWVRADVDGQLTTLAQSSQAANAAGVSTLQVAFTVPRGVVTNLTVRFYNGTVSGSTSATWFDDIAMFEGNGLDTNLSLIAPFTGATTNTSEYRYDWTGTAYASTATRTPILDRPADSLTWSPGQTAWDFITPLLQSAGLRLIPFMATSTATARWQVVTNEYPYRSKTTLQDAEVIAAGNNLYALTELVSLTASQSDGTPLYADAVVVHYQWRDTTTGADMEAYDTAGPTTAKRAYYVERRDVGYPGPGAAAYLLARLVARRRQLGVTAAIDYGTAPGQLVQVRSAEGDVFTGYLDAVVLDLAQQEMTVRTKGMVLTPTTAYQQQPDTLTYDTIASTVTYDSFTA